MSVQSAAIERVSVYRWYWHTSICANLDMDCTGQGKQALHIDESGLQEGMPQSACPTPRSWVLQALATHLHPSVFLIGS